MVPARARPPVLRACEVGSRAGVRVPPGRPGPAGPWQRRRLQGRPRCVSIGVVPRLSTAFAVLCLFAVLTYVRVGACVCACVRCCACVLVSPRVLVNLKCASGIIVSTSRFQFTHLARCCTCPCSVHRIPGGRARLREDPHDGGLRHPQRRRLCRRVLVRNELALCCSPTARSGTFCLCSSCSLLSPCGVPGLVAMAPAGTCPTTSSLVSWPARYATQC